MTRPLPQIDPSVLARARDGDSGAHAELYAAFAPFVYTLARRMLASTASAEDVLQETFVDIIRKISTFRGEAELGLWVRRIAVNQCLMHLRSAWSMRRVDTEHFDAEPCPVTTSADERIELERALETLPATARAVVWLHDVEGLTHREIAKLMGRTASFSKSQLARAHERLRAFLDCTHEVGDEPEQEPEGELPCDPALKTC
ncbi:MAG TPA: RNA polymerase sigma factor [Gammaproteobacteria bacterium]|jgi:RNA polymerase sigma-70 factor (ECF subfamily)